MSEVLLADAGSSIVPGGFLLVIDRSNETGRGLPVGCRWSHGDGDDASSCGRTVAIEVDVGRCTGSGSQKSRSESVRLVLLPLHHHAML